jgi:hypothetical protein
MSFNVAHGAKHLEPILGAIRDGVAVSFVHADEDIPVADGIAVLKDDVSHEPTIFRYPALDGYLKTCLAAFIVHEQPATVSYLCAAFDAVYLRRNVLIVETHISQVSKWQHLLLASNPAILLMVEIPESHGLAH